MCCLLSTIEFEVQVCTVNNILTTFKLKRDMCQYPAFPIFYIFYMGQTRVNFVNDLPWFQGIEHYSLGCSHILDNPHLEHVP